MTQESVPFGREDARRWIVVPHAGADKYSRGVLGVVTGSDRYPGAAVLGVEGAVRTGLGMVRYLGPPRAADFVLHRRPEIVTTDGRVQAWLMGSGMPPDRDDALNERLRGYLAQGLPTALDAGALDLAADATGPVVLTPHFGELSGILAAHGVKADRGTIVADPEHWARIGAETTGATVLLKGATTYLADAGGSRFTVQAGPPWVATAGAGDVLGGVLGALLAANSDAVLEDPARIAEVAAAAAWLHGEAGRLASGGGPVAALDIADAMSATIAEVLLDA